MLSNVFQNDRNKNLFLLVSILIHNLIYPLSNGDGIQPIVFYLVFSTMFVIAVYLLSPKRSDHIIITITGIIVFVSGLLNIYAHSEYTLVTLYVSAIIYHIVMMIVLVRYIFLSGNVLLEVVLAATSLYLVIGGSYTAMYGMIELLDPGSFAVASGNVINWQRLLYYSYVTLTTLGYGDITPVKFFAQSFAAFEAITGVLYTVILLSRLVSLYEDERDLQKRPE